MHKRVYRLQFDDNGKYACSSCDQLGLVAPFSRMKEDFKRSLTKLSNDLVQEVMLPCFAKNHPDYIKIKEKITEAGKKISVVTHDHKDSSGLLVIDDVSVLPDTLDRDLLIILKKGKFKLKEVLAKHNSFKGNSYYYAPLKTKLFEDKVSLKKVYKFIKKMKRNGIEVHPYPGLGVIETRAPIDLDFEPYCPKNTNSKKIKFSFIIPVFEQKEYLLRVLECIEKQNYNLEHVEVIIIDDGGADDLRKEIANRNSVVAIRYLYLQREIHREMGDFRFRAGIARNLGAKAAQGDIFFFLDADVLLPKTALMTLEKEIVETDLLQIKRFDLNRHATRNFTETSRIDLEKDIIHDGRSYWYNFFKQGCDWNNLKDSWKYICTYGLCVRSSDFYNYGGFQNNYIGYGFEDTDLGFRVHRNKGKFKLSEVISFHQYHTQERSEFRNSHLARRRILSRTAKIFFLNNLSGEIYEGLRDYM